MNNDDLRIKQVSGVKDCQIYLNQNNKDKNQNSKEQSKNKQEFVYEELKRVVKKHAKENETNIMELNFATYLVKDGFTIKEAATIADIDINDLTNYIYKTLKKTNKEEYNYIMDILREREFARQKRK